MLINNRGIRRLVKVEMLVTSYGHPLMLMLNSSSSPGLQIFVMSSPSPAGLDLSPIF